MAAGRTVNRAARAGFALAVAAAALLAPAAAPAAAEAARLVVLGDSLAAGFGLAQGAAFPARLEVALQARGHDVRVVNAGVSGDTTAGGLGRLDWAVGEDAEVVIVELGGNDALRGISPAQTRKNLNEILTRLDERELPVLLAGMLAPRNMGEDYAGEFDAMFTALAREHDVVFYPFFLDGVATDPALNQDDGIHPNAAGVEVIVERILPKVEELLARARAGAD